MRTPQREIDQRKPRPQIGGNADQSAALSRVGELRFVEWVMAPRAYWKGYLRLSLVSCPIQLFPATSEREKIRFHQLNKETGNRVRYRKVDEDTGDEDYNDVRPHSAIGERTPMIMFIAHRNIPMGSTTPEALI